MGFQDFTIALRVLLRERSFFLISVFILALAICGVTTQFSVIDAYLLRGLPVPEPRRLVSLALRDPSWSPERFRKTSSADFVDWTQRQTSFEGLAAYYTNGSFIVVTQGQAQRFAGSHVTPAFFSLLRVHPALGRDFSDADNRPVSQTPRVTIISDALWATEFGRDPNILGRTFLLDGETATVIGVMPPDFHFSNDRLWMPLFSEYPLAPRPSGNSEVLGRLKPGVSIAQASAEMTQIAQALAREYPLTNKNFTQVRIAPLIDKFIDPLTRQLFLAMLAAVVVVLAIACVNVTNLQLARAGARARDLAVRSAIGASRRRLLAPMLAESLIVVAVAGVAGLLLSNWTIGLMTAITARANGVIRLPAWIHYQINGEVLLFTLAAAVVSVLLSGLLPAWIASRANPIAALKEGASGHTGGRSHRLARSLVIGQIALTSALLAASLLLIKSIIGLQRQTLGYDGARVFTARMNLEGSRYGNGGALPPIYDRLLNRLRIAPGLEAVALTSRSNLISYNTAPFELPSRPTEPGRQPPTAIVDLVSEGYFAALGLKPLSGRDFTVTDNDSVHAVAIVNSPFAAKYLGRSNPIGQHLRIGSSSPQIEVTIVGVVPDTMMQGPLDDSSDGAGVFLPLRAFPQPYVTLVARSQGPAAAGLLAPLRRDVAEIDPTVALYAPSTPQTAFEQALFMPRALAATFSLFAGFAVVLAAVGLYGIAALVVGRRTREFGVRMALGATPANIMRIVLRQGTMEFAVGAALGLVGSLGLARLGAASLGQFLFRVNPRDPLIYATVLALLAAAAALAYLLPARRAARVDPLVALRAE